MLSRVALVGAKVLGVVCIVIAIGSGVLYLLMPWLSARNMREIYVMNVVPVHLPENGQAPLSGAAVEHYGFKFQLPSKAFRDGPETRYEAFVLGGGGFFAFHDPAEQDDSLFLKAIHDDEDAEKLLGSDLLHSRFLLMQVSMTATPEQVKWWRFRSLQNKRIQLLLMAKFFAFTGISSPEMYKVRAIYAVDAGELHGFQFGNPEVAPYDVHLDLFDKADRHLMFDSGGGAGHGQLVTQAELNAMVASIRPATDHSASAPAANCASEQAQATHLAPLNWEQ